MQHFEAEKKTLGTLRQPFVEYPWVEKTLLITFFIRWWNQRIFKNTPVIEYPCFHGYWQTTCSKPVRIREYVTLKTLYQKIFNPKRRYQAKPNRFETRNTRYMNCSIIDDQESCPRLKMVTWCRFEQVCSSAELKIAWQTQRKAALTWPGE